MMMRFTLLTNGAPDPGDCIIDCDAVIAVTEGEHGRSKSRTARIHMRNGIVFDVLDPDRTVADAVAKARDQWKEMDR